MPDGAGGVLAFELADGVIAGHCEEAVRLVRNATSLGGVETLIERRARIEPEGRVAEGLLRVAVGLENVEDLWSDLRQAIESAVAGGSAAGARAGVAAEAEALLGALEDARATRLRERMTAWTCICLGISAGTMSYPDERLHEVELHAPRCSRARRR